MSIKVVNNIKPKIIAGFVIDNIIYDLFYAIPNRERADEIIRDHFNMHPRRLFTIVQPYNGNVPVTVLVVYNKFVVKEERIKSLKFTNIENFDFPIFDYKKDVMHNLEMVIEQINQI